MAKVTVIGGGPAGMMAAASAAMCGHAVTLFERNEKLGKKLFLTGKGRCNVTNAAERQEFFENIPRNPKFLYSAFSALDNAALMRLIEENGCPLKVERGNRVFPVSDHSSDVIKALERLLRKTGVCVVLGARVGKICAENGAVSGIELDDGKFIASDAVILAAGGLSYPSTGSTGDGMEFARSLGLKVTEPSPSLVPLESNEQWVRSLQGLTLKNIKLTALNDGKVRFCEQGELLFTHFGVSGPLVLSASARLDVGKPAELWIDLKPALDEKTLDARLLRDFEKFSNKQIINALGELLPARLAAPFIELCGVSPQKTVNVITKAERARMVACLKKMSISVTGTRPIDEAIITRGGIAVSEVSASTMQCKSIAGLYFAGEMLDVDAYTGGFNLQIAFSTGFLAGRSIK